MTEQTSNAIAREIKQRVMEHREAIINFFIELVATPSLLGQIENAAKRMMLEMERLGFDEVRLDKMGNAVGRIGNGARVLVYDTHIDTVDIGDPSSWEWDPFKGKIENGILFARGACDEKGSAPGMIYGLTIARDLGLLDGYTCYCFGNLEEECDGIAPNSFVEADPKIRPDFAVIGEPTKMQVYRGHKGRVELKITAKGKSAHAASNFLGDNAIYKLLPIIAGIRDLDAKLPTHDFLGKAVVTVSDMKVSTVSLNAVPDEATIFIDRRVTFGETKESAIAAIDALIPNEQRDKIKLEELFYDEPSYTGFVFPVDKYYPAWALDEAHPLVQAGQNAIQALWNESRPTGKWSFSTNGTYWAGKAGIPSIGFGPGDEIYAHSTLDQNKLDDVVAATEFYALLPKMIEE